MSTNGHPNPDVAISLTDVSVRYLVASDRVDTLKEAVLRRLKGTHARSRDHWALDGVTLDIHYGEAVGIIGRNGAGKSTLLKTVARVLRPTRGRVWVRGTVAPLIELGTGFNQELTGRENVFLNGAMLGFSPAEMRAKFDRIVDFAELWDFIDAPMRVYSAGMIVRLGFAIASDVNPEILIIDELLAVGDIGFQQKCMERMQQFRQNGTTILFVSHAAANVAALCSKAVWIDDGKVRAVGDAPQLLGRYHKEMLSTT